MSRYRWLRPLTCIETMEYFPGTKDLPFDTLETLLHGAVERGDIRVMLNNETVPKAHIKVYLSLYARAAMAGESAHVLPPDVGLNYDDLCAVFDRPVIDNRKRGRPRREHTGWSDDEKLAFEMHKMLAGHPSVPKASSPTAAARVLVEAGKVSGAGTDESLIKRLVRAFRLRYTS